MRLLITVIIQKEENWYVAKCIENSVTSQGKTIEEVLINLKEAVQLYYEDVKPDIEEKYFFLITMDVEI